MFEAINRKLKIDASNTEGMILEDIKGEIQLKNVQFTYPARPDVKIFTGFSLQILSGTTAALVGQSGSGKSTVISLLERFYDPDSGEVLIDGVNLKKFQLSWIREKIGLVSQEPILFTTSIRDNIAYGKEGATDQDIRTAIELANAAKFIDKLPEGLDTMVGERGTQLSGRQKQKIAIARAILKNPRILLLNEATSALDAESERVVQDALDRIMTSRTTVIIAHRLTTIKNVDMIAVVHQGKIVEKGSHEELIKDPEGAYSQLVSLQDGASKKEATHMDSTPLDADPNLERTMSKSKSQQLSMRRSESRGSSSGHHSISISFSVPGTVNIHETIEGDDLDDGGRLIRRVRFMTFEKIVHQEIQWFNDPVNTSGAIGARLSTDASNIRRLVGDQLALIMQNLATVVAGLAIAFSANWILALIILTVAPLMFAQGYLQGKFMKGFSADAKLMYEEASQVANDAVGSIRTVASFCAEKKVMDLHKKKCEAPVKSSVRLGIISGLSFGFSFLALYCTNAFCFYIGAILIQHGKATFPQVFKVFYALTISAVGLSQSSSMAMDKTKAQDSAVSVFKILDSKPKIDSSSDEGTTLESVKGDIEFQPRQLQIPDTP